MRQQLPVVVGFQPRQRVEILAHEVLEQHIAVVQVLHAGDRQLVRCLLLAGVRERRRQQQRRRDRTRDGGPAQHRRWRYSQSRISNSGWRLACRSEIFSSRYFAPTDFSNFSCAPRE